MSAPTLTKDRKRAIVLGYEGFVGKKIIEQLSEHAVYDSIKAIGVKSADVRVKGVEYLKAEMALMHSLDLSCDDFFMCYDASFYNLGGIHYLSKENYKYIPKVVLSASRSGANQLFFLSSKKADRDSLFFSNRIRGLIEDSIRKIEFWATHIFRPAIIIGEESDQQWGKSMADALGKKVDQYTGGWLKKNKPIDAQVIALAMLDRAQQMRRGTFTYRGDWLQDFATQLPPLSQLEGQ